MMLVSAGLYNLLPIMILTVYFVPSGSVDAPNKSDSVLSPLVSSSGQKEKEPNSPTYSPTNPPTLGRYPPNKFLNQSATDEESTSAKTTEDNPKPVTGTLPEGPDGQAVQRAFIVLAGLGTIIIAYFGIKFACVKRHRRDRNPDPRYGLVETSEMDLLDGEEEDDDYADEDDTLFDLHSHRRT